MPYHVDRTAQLADASVRNRFGSVASLRRAGTPSRQHNATPVASAPKKKAAKKS